MLTVFSNSWNADSVAVWDLLSDQQRPYGWTSADAAGLPVFPGLVRCDEVAAGHVNHAIRFTLQHSSPAFTPPASHFAPNSTDPHAPAHGDAYPPEAQLQCLSFSVSNQVILNAMKKYGMIVADNGSSMYISGAPDDRWDNNDLHDLGSVTAGNFEVLQIAPLYTAATAPGGASPQIADFTASANSISAGAPVTLSWQVTGASYLIVSPEIGATCGSSATVHPAVTTKNNSLPILRNTSIPAALLCSFPPIHSGHHHNREFYFYTLYANNAFGQTISTATVTVR